MPDPALFNAVLRPAFEQLAGLKLAGFAVWERRAAPAAPERHVPRAAVFDLRRRRSFALLRPITAPTRSSAFRNAILEAYEKFEKLTTQLENARTLKGSDRLSPENKWQRPAIQRRASSGSSIGDHGRRRPHSAVDYMAAVDSTGKVVACGRARTSASPSATRHAVSRRQTHSAAAARRQGALMFSAA